MIDKERLHAAIIAAITSATNNAMNAANQAHETATNKESVAENKYDTFGLEASYLAHGQAQRVAEYKQALSCYRDLAIVSGIDLSIDLGMLVKLKDETGAELYLFLGPAAGGLKFHFDDLAITLITPSSPLGKSLLGLEVGDEVERQNKSYDILAIY